MKSTIVSVLSFPLLVLAIPRHGFWYTDSLDHSNAPHIELQLTRWKNRYRCNSAPWNHAIGAFCFLNFFFPAHVLILIRCSNLFIADLHRQPFLLFFLFCLSLSLSFFSACFCFIHSPGWCYSDKKNMLIWFERSPSWCFTFFTFSYFHLTFCFPCQKNGLPLSWFSLSLLYSILFLALFIHTPGVAGTVIPTGTFFPLFPAPLLLLLLLLLLVPDLLYYNNIIMISPPFISNIYTNTHDKVSEQPFVRKRLPWHLSS